MKLSDTEQRLLWLASAVAGIVHLAIPGVLLRLASWAYSAVLAVEFDPKRGARRRVRLLGLGFLGVAAASVAYSTADST